ncbi:MAG: M60 family metallopeptidase [Bacteroidaceae bacterium]|nr:M60 family metallopeptidase [Bacteroidaceae bacterium]
MKLRELLLTLLFALPIILTAQENDYELIDANKYDYYDILRGYFNDDICSELKEEYLAMSDEELRASMSELPEPLIDIALKIKNGWGEYEKEFRVASYKGHSKAYNWSNYLKTNPYSDLNNPTGIICNTNQPLIIFVDQSASYPNVITLSEVSSEQMFYSQKETPLFRGINVIYPSVDNGILYISYKVETTRDDSSKRLSEFPDIKVHIAGGTLNGYFDKSRHTNDDWVKMRKSIMKHEIAIVKGEKAIFSMHLGQVAQICPNNIYESIDWWDTIVRWQHELMGAAKYADRWNNLMMCCDGQDSYMYATWYYTYYAYSTLSDILPANKVMANPGLAWGPAHEIGHMNQAAINIVSCTEVSNNLFANVVVWRIGKTTTRGLKVSQCIEDFNNKVPYPLRDEVFSKTRMYWQLYLYFHEAKRDTTFYPRLFEYLRDTPLSSTSSVNGKFNQLRFAEACCEVAQMDLSEFFDAWGFFEPMNGAHVGDYNDYYVTLSEIDAAQSRAKMQQYSKKGGHLMFLEDRVKPSKRTDGVAGYRADFNADVPVGSAGSVGQWEDYIDESVKAEGYLYTTTGKYVTILTDENSKGAVGFKIYDKYDKMVSFSNTYSMKVPTELIGTRYKVVAVQADGSNVEIPSAAVAGNEEQQLSALEDAIEAAQAILRLQASNTTQVGYYEANAVSTLQSLVESAQEAIDNKDQSTLTYGQWCTYILNEVYRIQADDNAMISVKPYNYYTATTRLGALAFHGGIVKAASNAQVKPASSDRLWEFVPAAHEHTFYLRNVGQNGYLQMSDDAATLVGTTAEATIFKLHFNGDGTTSLVQSGIDEFKALGVKSDKSAVALSAIEKNSQWKIILTTDNTAIESPVEDCGTDDTTIYDLSGRRVENPEKGIYIVNGRKVFIK